MKVTLTGYMGSGKSSVGKSLSTLLSLPFVDLDTYIVEKQGRSIPDIFAQDGEPAFRTMEKEALEELLTSGRDMVLALGGGAVMTPACAALVMEHSTCFYLKASTDTLIEHLTGTTGRPLLAGGPDREKIEAMLKIRGPVYESVCDYVIDVNGQGVRKTSQDIKAIIEKL